MLQRQLDDSSHHSVCCCRGPIWSEPTGSGAEMIARVISTLGSVTQGVLSGRNSLHGLLQGLVCQIMVQGINVLTGVIVARLLGPDGRGAFVVMTLWPQLLSILLVAGLPVATIYNLRHHPSESANAAGALVVFGTIGVLAGGLIGQLLIPAVLTHWS